MKNVSWGDNSFISAVCLDIKWNRSYLFCEAEAHNRIATYFNVFSSGLWCMGNGVGTMGCRCFLFDKRNYFTTDDSKQLKTTITDKIQITLQVILLTTHNRLYDKCSSIIIHSSCRIFDRCKELDSIKGFSYLAGDCDFYFYNTNTSYENVLHESILLDRYNGIMGSQFWLMVVHNPTELMLLVSLWRSSAHKVFSPFESRCKMYIHMLFDRGKRYVPGLLESYLVSFGENQFICVQNGKKVTHGWVYKQVHRSKSLSQALIGLMPANDTMWAFIYQPKKVLSSLKLLAGMKWIQFMLTALHVSKAWMIVASRWCKIEWFSTGSPSAGKLSGLTWD